ncbi:WD40-repeat-containing domain protein [Baffinella frigidus]|nr:WD40-repeat-containing domain protein [Cryptophyta sp. CCMP2293]
MWGSFWQVRTIGHTGSGSCICTGKDGEVNAIDSTCNVAGHAGWVDSVTWSPDGKCIVSGSTDKLRKIWDAATGAEVCTLTGHSGWVWSTSFSPDGKHIVSGAADRLVKLWDAETGAEVSILE